MWSPDLVRRAQRFAAERHAAQKVPGSMLPYLTHVTAVATEVIWGHSVEPLAAPDLAIVCALLHDTVEDTATTLDELVSEFGDEVGHGVAALTKNRALPEGERMADCLARIRARPQEIWAVKLADRVVNLSEPPATWSREKRLGYQEEARAIHAALHDGHHALGDRLAAKIVAYTAWL